MTSHVHEPVIRPSSEIATRAREVHPVQFASLAALTTIAALFTSVGWVVGTSWFLLVFTSLWIASRLAWTGACVRYGFHTGARHEFVEDKQA